MPKKKAVWTVMIYLAGDNNLTSECFFALTEMKKALPGEHINVIAQFDPRDERVPTQRYEINRKGPNSSIFDDIIDEAHFDRTTREVRFKHESNRARLLAKSRSARLKEIRSFVSETDDLSPLAFEQDDITDETDTGSPITFYNFLSFCLEAYEAEHYLVVLSGHSGGTDSDFLLTDESSKGSLTFNELKAVFKHLEADLNGQTIDIIGMDNCLMSMAEICYELKGIAQFLVGSEAYSPASGWPYRQVIERLKKESSNSNSMELARNVAIGIVEEYTNYYSGYWLSGMSVAQSALDLCRVEDLRSLVNKLGCALEKELLEEFEPDIQKRVGRNLPHPFCDQLVLAHWEAQSYNGELFVDLYDFCNCLERRAASREVREACSRVKDFVESEFVVKSCFCGAKYQYSYGLSIYFPWSQVAASYWNLEFIKTSTGIGWGSFLNTYTLVTRREARDADTTSLLAQVPIPDLTTRLSQIGTADDRMAVDRMAVDRMADDRMADDRMADDRMADDRMAVDRMADDRMMSGANGKNPIHSMRNPPVIFFPTECIRDRENVIAAQEQFWKNSKSKN
jgi:pentapeptide MXKDX repeat protein